MLSRAVTFRGCSESWAILLPGTGLQNSPAQAAMLILVHVTLGHALVSGGPHPAELESGLFLGCHDLPGCEGEFFSLWLSLKGQPRMGSGGLIFLLPRLCWLSEVSGMREAYTKLLSPSYLHSID